MTRIQELCIVAGGALLIGMGAMWVMSPKEVRTVVVPGPAVGTVRPSKPTLEDKLSPEEQKELDRLAKKALGNVDARCSNVPGQVWIDGAQTCVPWPPGQYVAKELRCRGTFDEITACQENIERLKQQGDRAGLPVK